MFTLVIGGSASGKSEFAELLLISASTGPLFYVATMIPFDQECRIRIKRHREMRCTKGFSTVECPVALEGWVCPPGAGVLLECMSNLAANEYYDPARGQSTFNILAALEHLAACAGELVVVTNDVFADGVTYPPETEGYLAYLAEINCGLAAMADQVVEVVYTLPIFHKGGSAC